MDTKNRHPITMDPTTACRVCRCGTAAPFIRVDEREYWSCPMCTSIFLDEAQLPDRETEYQQYVLHNNDPQDPGYQTFLNKLAEPLLKKLTPGMKGLDFGCGEGPALGLRLADMGYEMSFYDPFFFQSDVSVLSETYDFIVCSEVAEHFHRPSREFAGLDAMLNPNGWLGIMTCFQTDDLRFAHWHYRRDLTHVVFYREETFHVLARQLGWDCHIPAKNIVLLQKSGPCAPVDRRQQIPERRPR